MPKSKITICKTIIVFPKTILFFLLAFSAFLFTTPSLAQTTQTLTYNIKNGLPSNSVYITAIDNRGFLWIATELGLSRFDGKKFKNYTTSDGLTDNEIVNLTINNDGTMWAVPFNRPPCYYDATKDVFINSEIDTALSKIKVRSANKSFSLKYGGTAFIGITLEFGVYKNGKSKQYLSNNSINKQSLIQVLEFKPNAFLLFSGDSIRKLENGKLFTLMPTKNTPTFAEHFNNKVYVPVGNSIFVYSYDINGNVKFEREKTYPFYIRIFCFTGKHMAVTTLTGNTYLLDKFTLEPIEIISATEGVAVRHVLEDKDDNIWLSTIDKGLIKVQKKRIANIDRKELKQNFNTVAKTSRLFVGNNNGEVFSYDGLYIKPSPIGSKKNIDAWIRKIIPTKYGIYVVGQSASYLLDTINLSILKEFKKVNNRSAKAGYLVNDSLLLMGSHYCAYKFNLKNEKVIDSIIKRVVSLGSDLFDNYYIGSSDGLFLWQHKKLINLSTNQKGLSYKVNTIISSPDSLLWVGLASDSIIVLRNNKWIASLHLGDIIPGTICKVLQCNKTGEVWLGTNKGLNRISYTYSNNQFNYTNTYFGIADGLASEQVNDIALQDSLVYVATTEGINQLNNNIRLPIADINTFITSVSINNVSSPIQSKYNLNYYENDISIDFSGVDLTGFLPLYEYNINNGNWKRTEKIELKKLAAGNYTINIRAIKRDGQPSANKATLQLNINTPFWKNILFWLSVFFVCFAGILYWQFVSNKKQKLELQQKIQTQKKMTDLEMQALKAQINPHFIFNCLNSIKSLIYDKDYQQADKYLDKFAELMRTTIDHSDASLILLEDEIKYLDNYLQLEKLRFEEKFTYKIIFDKKVSNKKVYVPAMMLQPYLENAIRHGIRYLQHTKGFIVLTADILENKLVFTIDDNGIGREKSAELKSAQHIEYQSKGMSISNKRAELYNIEQHIIDKKNEEGLAKGTTIILKIPLNLKND